MIDTLMRLFQLDPALYVDRFLHELSGGHQQRVGMASALAAEPNVLPMDKSFGVLGPVIRAKAQNDLLDIQRKLGVTVVLVMHGAALVCSLRILWSWEAPQANR